MLFEIYKRSLPVTGRDFFLNNPSDRLLPHFFKMSHPLTEKIYGTSPAVDFSNQSRQK